MSEFFRRPWDSQPPPGTPLGDWAPPKTIAYIGNARNIIGGSYSESGTINVAYTVGGVAISSGTTGSYISLGAQPQLLVGATVVVPFVKRDDSVRYIMGEVDTGSNYTEDIAVNMSNTGAASAGRFVFGLRADGSGTNRIAHTAQILTSGILYTAVIRIVSASSYDIYINGASQDLAYSNAVNVAQSVGLTDYPLALANRNVRGAFSSGTNVDILLYLRTPATIDDPASVSLNPWQLFEPQRIFIPEAAGGGAFPTLSLPTYMPGSLTSVGFRPRVTAT